MGSETAQPYDGDREQIVPIAMGPCTTEGTEGKFPTGIPGLIPECHVVTLMTIWGRLTSHPCQ